MSKIKLTLLLIIFLPIFALVAVIVSAIVYNPFNTQAGVINPSVVSPALPSCLNINKEQAIAEVAKLPKVQEFMRYVGKLSTGIPDKIIEVSEYDTQYPAFWRVHVFFINEIFPYDAKLPDEYIGARAMTNTFSRYQVDKCTGNVVCVELTNVNSPSLPVCGAN